MILGTQKLKLLSFVCAFKYAHTNSIVNGNPNISRYAKSIGVSSHTFNKYLALSKKKGFLISKGLNYQFISLPKIINKLFPDNSINQKHRFFSSFDRVKNNGEFCTMSEMEYSITQTIIGRKLSTQNEQILKKKGLLVHVHHGQTKGKEAILKQHALNGGKFYKKVTTKNLKLNEQIVFGKYYIAKAVGFSASTSHRRIKRLKKEKKLRSKVVLIEVENKFLLERERTANGVVFYSKEQSKCYKVAGSVLLTCNMKGFEQSGINPFVRFKNSKQSHKAMLRMIFKERRKEKELEQFKQNN